MNTSNDDNSENEKENENVSPTAPLSPIVPTEPTNNGPDSEYNYVNLEPNVQTNDSELSESNVGEVDHFRNGIVKLGREELDGAINDFLKAKKNNPTDFQIWKKIAVCYGKKKEFKRAISIDTEIITFLESKNILKGLPHLYNQRGFYLNYKLKKYDKALQDFNKGIEICIKNDMDHRFVSVLYSNRANCYRSLKRFDLALKDYEKSLEEFEKFGKNTFRICRNIGNFFIMLRKYEKAIEYFSKSLQGRPCKITYFRRGMLYNYIGKWNLALNDYNESIRLKDYFEITYLARGLLYFQMRKWQKASDDLIKFKSFPEFFHMFSFPGQFILMFLSQKLDDLKDFLMRIEKINEYELKKHYKIVRIQKQKLSFYNHELVDAKNIFLEKNKYESFMEIFLQYEKFISFENQDQAYELVKLAIRMGLKKKLINNRGFYIDCIVKCLLVEKLGEKKN